VLAITNFSSCSSMWLIFTEGAREITVFQIMTILMCL